VEDGHRGPVSALRLTGDWLRAARLTHGPTQGVAATSSTAVAIAKASNEVRVIVSPVCDVSQATVAAAASAMEVLRK
ncbi:MAG: hypothetical protein AB7U92_23520, partial [Piscinibacter sp.]|uniref:hypothetical protein n=1 Tax=Piscinibacter sp. TaxID=1903157 RepID=UPI003D14653E